MGGRGGAHGKAQGAQGEGAAAGVRRDGSPPTAPPQTVRGEAGKDPGIADGDGTCCVLFVPRALAHSRPSLASLLQHL